eukprot:g27413.t1
MHSTPTQHWACQKAKCQSRHHGRRSARLARSAPAQRPVLLRLGALHYFTATRLEVGKQALQQPLRRLNGALSAQRQRRQLFQRHRLKCVRLELPKQALWQEAPQVARLRLRRRQLLWLHKLQRLPRLLRLKQPPQPNASKRGKQKSLDGSERRRSSSAKKLRFLAGFAKTSPKAQTLRAYISNLAKHPQEPKYQSINCENNNFRSKVASVEGAIAVLEACGFVADGTKLLVDAEFLKTKGRKLWDALSKASIFDLGLFLSFIFILCLAELCLEEETELYRVPQGVIRCFSYLLQHLSSRRAEDVHLIAVSLHVLRNVAGNYKEVMDGSAEAFRECFEGSLLAQGQGTATFGQVLPQLPEPSSREATVATGARPQLESEAAGNPQESDECQLGSEEVLAKRQEVTEVRPVSASVTAATGAPEAASGSFVRCDQRFALSSLCLQAIFQSTELLQSLPLSEEDVRRKVMVMAREARDIELSESRRRRQSFHGIRLYFLICRSSHVRRQYAMLEPSVLEEERQTVAFLLSVSRDQHCILLRAMAQDVQSWLMWQSKAFTKRRTERSQKRRSPARPTHPAEEQVVEPCNPSSGSLQPVGLFTAGEAVWMAHSLLVLAIALCLVAYWNSLEHTPASQAAVAKTGHVAGYLLYWR